MIQVAQTLKRELNRPIDLVARLGAEEFAIILPETVLEGRKTVVERLLQRVRVLKIEQRGALSGDFVTASFGLACVTHDFRRAVRATPHPNLDSDVLLVQSPSLCGLARLFRSL